MQKIKAKLMKNLVGADVHGYLVEKIRFKHGKNSDRHNYGFFLGKDYDGNYVTWQFHIDDESCVRTYWGHFCGADSRDAALRDYRNRDKEEKPFKVSITGNLHLTVDVQAVDHAEAERFAADIWQLTDEYALDPNDNFTDVKFNAVPPEDQSQ